MELSVSPDTTVYMAAPALGLARAPDGDALADTLTGTLLGCPPSDGDAEGAGPAHEVTRMESAAKSTAARRPGGWVIGGDASSVRVVAQIGGGNGRHRAVGEQPGLPPQ
jgi:hypothetical protein